MYIGKDLRSKANNLGLKLYVSKRDGKSVLNIYDIEHDRLLCNYDGYGGKFIRGRHKILRREAFLTLPIVLTKYKHIHELLEVMHDIVKAEKAANNLQLSGV